MSHIGIDPQKEEETILQVNRKHTSTLKKALLFVGGGTLATVGTIAAIVLSSRSDISQYGYPLNQQFGGELLNRAYAKIMYDEEVTEQFQVENVQVTVIRNPREQVGDFAPVLNPLLNKVILELKQKLGDPINHPKNIIIILHNTDGGTTGGDAYKQSQAITPTLKDSTDLVPIIITDGSDQGTLKHEMIHALYQKYYAKELLPRSVGEGIVHMLTHEQRSFASLPMDSDYVLQNFRGIVPPDLNYIPNADAHWIQQAVMERFWYELGRVDPTIMRSLLQQYPAAKEITAANIAEYLLALASPSRQVEVMDFLKKVRIFDPPQERNGVLIVDPWKNEPTSEQSYPSVSHFLFDRQGKFVPDTTVTYEYRLIIDSTVIQQGHYSLKNPENFMDVINKTPLPTTTGQTYKVQLLDSSGKDYPREVCFTYDPEQRLFIAEKQPPSGGTE